MVTITPRTAAPRQITSVRPAGELCTSARLGPHVRTRQLGSLRWRLASPLDASAPATVSSRSLSIRVTRDRAKLTVQPARCVEPPP